MPHATKENKTNTSVVPPNSRAIRAKIGSIKLRDQDPTPSIVSTLLNQSDQNETNSLQTLLREAAVERLCAVRAPVLTELCRLHAHHRPLLEDCFQHRLIHVCTKPYAELIQIRNPHTYMRISTYSEFTSRIAWRVHKDEVMVDAANAFWELHVDTQQCAEELIMIQQDAHDALDALEELQKTHPVAHTLIKDLIATDDSSYILAERYGLNPVTIRSTISKARALLRARRTETTTYSSESG